MYPCILEFWAKDIVFDIIEGVDLVLDFNELDVPDGIDVRDSPLNGFYTFYGIVVNDEFDGESVVGIDPVSHLLRF
jgi:hypothetical protein